MKKGIGFHEPIIFGFIFFIAILFFGLFLLTASNLKKDIQDDESAQKIASYDGYVAIQAYLRTPLNVDTTRYLNGTSTSAFDMTVGEALPKVLEECIASDNDFCTAFRKRSMLFLQSVCQYDYVLTIQGNGALRISPQGPKSFESTDSLSGFGGKWVDSEDFARKGVLLVAEQSLPTIDGVIIARLACLARHGVDS